MTTHDEKNTIDTHDRKITRTVADIGGVVGSMIGLVQAGTQFSVEQLQNAAGLFTDPKAALGRVKDSIDNLSNAMTGKTEVAKLVKEDSDGNRVEVQLNGRKS